MSDVIIIGASLSGAATAISLAKEGLSVTVVDRTRFPRRKPCGEGLSGRGQAELRAIGVDLSINSGLGHPLLGYRIVSPDSIHDITDYNGLQGVRRYDLDARLLDHLGTFPSARQRLDATVERVDADGKGFKVTIGGEVFSAPHLVIADGARSPTLKALGKPLVEPRFPRLGASSSWVISKGGIQPYVHIWLTDDGELYLTPLSDRGLNISALGSKRLIQRAAHPSLLSQLLSPLFQRLEIEAEMTAPPLGSGALNSSYHGAHFKGAFVVGDACESFDPCAGCGMTHALLSGRLAAHHIIQALKSSRREDELLAYARVRELEARGMRGYTRLTSLMMGTSMGRIALPLAASSGLAGMVSRAANSTTGPRPVRTVISLVGRTKGEGRIVQVAGTT